MGNRYECDKCPAGYYCDAEGIECASLTFGTGSCSGIKVCPKGAYCETGSALPTECGPGFYRSDSARQAAVNQTSCSLCPSGYYCDEYGMHDDDSDALKLIKNCPQGSYCPPGSILPEPCDAGSYGDGENFRSSFECKLCDPGYYCPNRSMTQRGPECAAGQGWKCSSVIPEFT